MEIRKRLIDNSERFQSSVETSNKEQCTDTKRQIATEIKTRPAKNRNQQQTSSGKDNNNNKNDDNSKNRSENKAQQEAQRGNQTPNKTRNQGSNKARKDQPYGVSNGSKKKFKVLIVGDSQLRYVDESSYQTIIMKWRKDSNPA